MSTMKVFMTRHPVATYFALTLTISWGGVLAVLGPSIRDTREEFEKLLSLAFLPMLPAPASQGFC